MGEIRVEPYAINSPCLPRMCLLNYNSEKDWGPCLVCICGQGGPSCQMRQEEIVSELAGFSLCLKYKQTPPSHEDCHAAISESKSRCILICFMWPLNEKNDQNKKGCFFKLWWMFYSAVLVEMCSGNYHVKGTFTDLCQMRHHYLQLIETQTHTHVTHTPHTHTCSHIKNTHTPLIHTHVHT